MRLVRGHNIIGFSLFKFFSLSVTVEDNDDINNIIISLGMWKFYTSLSFAKMKDTYYEVTTTEHAES